METLHKLAGVTEASDLNEKPSHPVPEPPPIPQDSDAESQYDRSRHGSRASLPINRRPSNKSFRSSRRSASRSRGEARSPGVPPEDYPPLPTTPGHSQPGRPSHESAQTGVSVNDEDFIWGPGHPCYPHPNPHCTPDSEEAKNTRVIRVRRDWLQIGDVYPQYANLYPEILDPLVTDDEFRFLISNINARLKATFDPYSTRAWADALLGVATGFIWDDLGLTGSKQGVKGLETFIENWNKEKERAGKEVRLAQLRSTGFMALDFVVPDPGIDVVQQQGDEGDGEVDDGGIGPAE